MWRTAQPLRLAAGSCRSDERDGAAMAHSDLSSFSFPIPVELRSGSDTRMATSK
ncbi:hypothetical protein L903_23090 [Agrobacterium sp. JL28]|nr:hypothetical protein L903_23090 [Agrobacterium sp. JL28]